MWLINLKSDIVAGIPILITNFKLSALGGMGV
jgi:hypothetical protein